MNTFALDLDLDKTPDVPDWVILRQGDKSGTVIVATIYDHGVQLVGTYTARVVIGNPDGEHYYRANATYNAGVATVTIDEQTAASVAGSTVGYFEIMQGSTVIASTANFGVRILESALDGAVPGENYDTAIQDAIDGLNAAVAELPDTVEGILEDHPEWTTTVQDGSISVPKLASEVRSSLSGAILAAIGGTLVTAHDAAAVPPNAASVFGRSTQSGTPTPSSPAAITSVTAAELHVGLEYGTDATGWPLAIDLQGHELRSLPDGTRDELRIDAAGNVTLVQRVYEWQMKDFYDKGWSKSGSATNGYYVSCSQITPVPATSTQTGHHDCILSNMATAVATTSIYFSTTNSCYLDSSLNFNLDGSIVGTTLSNFKTWLSTSSITLVGPLATPQEISLGAVTLPDLPSPDLTAWAAQGAELAVTYQRDATLVIAGIYAQLAPVDGPTATSNHGVGTYLMLGGTLCKVTTAIAAGETIAIGTNVVATNVMTEILALTA